jgi:hypothetical protein
MQQVWQLRQQTAVLKPCLWASKSVTTRFVRQYGSDELELAIPRLNERLASLASGLTARRYRGVRSRSAGS